MTDVSTTRWVFGYGSLIWNPGFAFLRSLPAMLNGAHRSLSVYSYRHRGTPERPGLVFGLTRGGSCRGVAFEIDAQHWDEVHNYLIERESDRGVYLESWRKLHLASGQSVRALAFMVDEAHTQFAGGLDVDEQLRLIRGGTGQSGPNVDYVLNTARHLAALGIRDRYVMRLADALEREAA